ncbi:(2Fe-2S)-binding protein [Planctomycetota bacterium]|nr:(2Fe-2S)-binding protein [Planctomycetota bacterium]
MNSTLGITMGLHHWSSHVRDNAAPDVYRTIWQHTGMTWDFRKPDSRICVCFEVTNDQALEVWKVSPEVAALRRVYDCGKRCAKCIPYFETLLKEYKAGTWPPCQ